MNSEIIPPVLNCIPSSHLYDNVTVKLRNQEFNEILNHFRDFAFLLIHPDLFIRSLVVMLKLAKFPLRATAIQLT